MVPPGCPGVNAPGCARPGTAVNDTDAGATGGFSVPAIPGVASPALPDVVIGPVGMLAVPAMPSVPAWTLPVAV